VFIIIVSGPRLAAVPGIVFGAWRRFILGVAVAARTGLVRGAGRVEIPVQADQGSHLFS